MTDADRDGELWLGAPVDPATHERSDAPLLLEADDLTTHGVIVGMTGSGKTGLGIVLLEEALLEDIPVLVLDPKGDMGNLLLTFPELAASDFAPWVGADADPAATAQVWREGLAGWGIDGERIARLRERAAFRIFTPGSTAGIPLNVVGDPGRPEGEVDDEDVADRIEAYVSGLLGLVDIDADPLASPEHILLSNLIAHEWAAGRSPDLGTLVGLVQRPPMRKLGVIELDDFFPASERTALAMRLNGLLASPAFAAWAQGLPLRIEDLLRPDGDRAGAAIVSLAHLSDAERQFAVTLVLSELIAWMRAQAGSTGLRVLVYMDEVVGFVPPTAMPPAKKPILTLLKQARAYGVGLVLSTQNPVDLDYKAISNAGTWMVGRLQTERDRDRLLDGMMSAAGTTDRAELAATMSGLGKRQFVLHRTRGDAPSVFTTRWAMSYLAGPLTRDQISSLVADDAGSGEAPAATTATPVDGDPPLADDETELLPEVADGVPVRFLDPSASWAERLGAVPGGRRLRPALAVTVDLLYDDHHADVRHDEIYEAVLFPIDDGVDPDDLLAVDHDERDLAQEPPEGSVYVLSDARLNTRRFFSDAEATVRDHLHRSRTISIHRNRELKLWSRVGESAEEFGARCREVADAEVEREIDGLRRKMERSRDRLVEAIRKADDRVRELEADLAGRRTDSTTEVVGALLGSLLGGRRSTRSAARSLRSDRRAVAKLEERLETALNRLDEGHDDLEELERDLADRIGAIEDEWAERAAAVEEHEVPLDKSDISVREPVLVWVPTGP